MTQTLKDLLLGDNRPAVIRDTVKVIENEVSKKKGLGGMVIKGGFKVVSKIDGGRFLENAVSYLIDDFVEEMESFHSDFVQTGQQSYAFKDFIMGQADTVTNALLSVTDRRRNKAKNKVLIKTYDKLRSVAFDNVKEGLPGLSVMIQKYMN